MKGNNTLIFNHATMMEAVQGYLDKIMMKAPVVQSIKLKSSSSGYRSETEFEIEVSTPDTTGTVP